MRNYFILFLSLTTILLTACKTTQIESNNVDSWHNVAVIEGVEIYVDTQSIRHDGTTSYAREKRVYATPESKKEYVDRIRKEYTQMGKPQKADKWNDVSYSIYHCVYECNNRRFRVVSVEDFDTNNKRIVKTTPAKGTIKWLNVNSDTVGDYTTFFVCDYAVAQ